MIVQRATFLIGFLTLSFFGFFVGFSRLKANEETLKLQDSKNVTTLRLMKFWDYPSKNTEPKPINGRFILFDAWQAGHNNRRMSLELAYVFAWITNRTLVLPKPDYFYPFPNPISYSAVYDMHDLKAGVPTIEHAEFQALPDLSILLKDKIIANFTDIPTQESVFAVPKLPAPNTTEHEKYEKWRYPRALGDWGVQNRDTYTIPRWNESLVIEFPANILFGHFYLYFYFTPESSIRFSDITKLVRDHVHFRPEIYEAASWIVNSLPNNYSTLHYRRGDLQFPENRNIKPQTIYENTKKLFIPGEVIYVATDEDPEIFKKEFISVFEPTYKILTFQPYAHFVSGLPDVWVPLIEQLVCSQGRVFVGTRQSTFSGYITRLRGYMKHINDKNLYWTITKYPEGYETEESFSPHHHKTWNREYPEAWESIKD